MTAKRVVVKEIPVQTGSFRTLPTSLVVGAGVGFFGWLLYLLFNHWLLAPVFCRSADTSGICANTEIISWATAFIIVGLTSLFALVRAGIFRPLLVVVAALATLWATGLWFSGGTWWVGLIWSTVLFALAYALYAWLASYARFVFSIILIVIAVLLFRLFIVA